VSEAPWSQQSVNIMGAGPTGALLAILLQRRGIEVTLYESRRDPRGSTGESGRSINLALADRGIHALKLAGVHDAIAGTLVPMRGRMIHQQDGSQSLHLYGQRPSEVIYSVSRHVLNQALLDVAQTRHGVRMNFEHRVEDIDFTAGSMRIHDLRRDAKSDIPLATLLATDGAGSLVRRRMSAAGLIEATEADLEHGYKELTIPAAAGGGYRMERDALHIWPRGNFMLIALPNTDGSFTATLFLAKHGAVSFDSLATPAAVEVFLATHFMDIFQQMPDCVAEFQANPTGFLGTVHASPWSVGGIASLVGDAAHAIVPFHGQGMNCCFEDCLEFDECLRRNATWESVFSDFHASRKPNTDAIADMAIENYLEMRERVADAQFRLQQTLALELERRHPTRFIPRYSMVMFHHEIPYAVARQRGLLQTQILTELTANATALADVDYALADRIIAARLPPLGSHAPA
jgi:kynurenine 3-monooxygenase